MAFGGRLGTAAALGVLAVATASCGSNVIQVGDDPKGKGDAGGELPPRCDFFTVAPGGSDLDASGECPCTLRSEQWLQSSKRVGPAGGMVGALEGSFAGARLAIPPNALNAEVEIRITQTMIPTPPTLHGWSPLYLFEPVDLTFNTPVEVGILWQSSISQPGDLTIYWSEEPGGCALAPLSDNYQNAGFNQGSVRTLGWAIVGVRR